MEFSIKTSSHKLMIISFFIACSALISCNEVQNVPVDTKYLERFNNIIAPSDTINITTENLALYVDY